MLLAITVVSRDFPERYAFVFGLGALQPAQQRLIELVAAPSCLLLLAEQSVLEVPWGSLAGFAVRAFPPLEAAMRVHLFE